MSAPGPTAAAVYYRWRDPQGVVHIVDSLDKVPEAARATAERIVLVPSVKRQAPSTSLGPLRIDWESFGAGFATAFAMAFVFIIARRTKKPWLEFVMLLGAAAVIVGIYFAWSAHENAKNSPPADIGAYFFDDSKSIPDKTKNK